MASTAPTLLIDTDDGIVLPAIPMSYEAYLEWYDKEEGRRGEWVDGEVIPFMSFSPAHDRIVIFLVQLIGTYLDLRGLPRRVFGDEFELRTREKAAREPDLFLVLGDNLDRYDKMRWTGACDIAVEVISPDSVTRDREDKYGEYQALGIPEYWIIDPRSGKERIDMFHLSGSRTYEAGLPDMHGRMRSSVLPGVWLDKHWLTDQLPSVVQTAATMAGLRITLEPIVDQDE